MKAVAGMLNDKLPVQFTTCCDKHDIAYSTCGGSRLKADKDLLNCLRHAADVTKQYAAVPSSFYRAVKSFGDSSFDTAQKQYCKCRSPSKPTVVRDMIPQYKGGVKEKVSKAISTAKNLFSGGDSDTTVA
jgi:hypothetical protein